ncbi:MAG: SPASM domain-containing protein, partial [Clostridia bacterium]|nr:SPASM domain-containing protein [Clostridia bacterium]
KDYNIEKWHISSMMPFGNASIEYMLTNKEWNDFVDEIIQITPFRLGIRKLYDIGLLDSLSDEQIQQISINERNENFKNCGCIKAKLYIYPDMMVYGCTCMKDMPLGSMKNESLKDIIINSKSQYIVKYKASSSVCKTCRFMPICNGGCLGMQMKYGADIRCPFIQKEGI